MTSLRLANTPSIDHQADWSSFRPWIDGTYANLRYSWIESSATYEVVAVDGIMLRTVGINKDSGTAHLDFEDNFKQQNPTILATPDGRPITVPISFEDGTFLYVCGAGDHLTNGRGEGQAFCLQRSTAGSSYIEWAFNDWVKAVGGTGFTVGGAIGDVLDFELYAPATTLQAVTPGEGAVILVDTGYDVEGTTLNIIVPYPPGGTHNIVSAIPVPASIGEPSYWAWNQPNFGLGSVAVAGTTGYQNGYNLYGINLPLAKPASKLNLLGDRNLSIDTGNVKPMLILPHWKFRATLTTTDTRDVRVAWELKCVRMRSTKIW